MNKEFWNTRYAETPYAYGIEPNVFFKTWITGIPVGKLLLPAEGEGRNAVFAASLGWQVHAIDQSISGKEKALSLAEKHQVTIDYHVEELESIHPGMEQFDAIALIFAHFPPDLRAELHRRYSDALKPGGWILLQAFSKAHLQHNSKNPHVGGPRDESLLYSANELMSDFKELKVTRLSTEECMLNEGLYHCGESSLISLVAQKSLV